MEKATSRTETREVIVLEQSGPRRLVLDPRGETLICDEMVVELDEDGIRAFVKAAEEGRVDLAAWGLADDDDADQFGICDLEEAIEIAGRGAEILPPTP